MKHAHAVCSDNQKRNRRNGYSAAASAAERELLLFSFIIIGSFSAGFPPNSLPPAANPKPTFETVKITAAVRRFNRIADDCIHVNHFF